MRSRVAGHSKSVKLGEVMKMHDQTRKNKFEVEDVGPKHDEAETGVGSIVNYRLVLCTLQVDCELLR
jgi:hypothetical protein